MGRGRPPHRERPVSPHDDPRFWTLREALSNYAGDPDDPEPRPGEALQAAVSLVLRGKAKLELLLIKRAPFQGDPWSGHMALPGGRREPEDGSLLETAIRETREEVGIALEGTGSLHLGRLEEVSPSSARLPSLSIHPFVFGVPRTVEARPDGREVASAHWVEVEPLRNPDAVETVEIQLRDERREFPCFPVAGEAVWGLTYRILRQFLEVSPSLLEEGREGAR